MRWESQYDYLIHYGVKGQKHGVRRYQNEDGTLTAEGRDHYGVGDSRNAGGPRLHAKQGRTAEIKSLFKKKNKTSGDNKTEEETKKSKDSESKTAKNSGRAKKILAAAAATSLAALATYAVAKKTTKMRDDYRAQERDKAQEWLGSHIKLMKSHLRDVDEVKLDRRDPRRKDVSSDLKSFHIQSARRSAQLRDYAGREYEKHKKISETATRRDAVKNYIDEKRTAKALEKRRIAEAREEYLKNSRRR